MKRNKSVTKKTRERKKTLKPDLKQGSASVWRLHRRPLTFQRVAKKRDLERLIFLKLSSRPQSQPVCSHQPRTRPLRHRTKHSGRIFSFFFLLSFFLLFFFIQQRYTEQRHRSCGERCSQGGGQMTEGGERGNKNRLGVGCWRQERL